VAPAAAAQHEYDAGRATSRVEQPCTRRSAISPAPQMRDTGRTAASLTAETSLVACRQPLGTILLLQPATYQLVLQHLHSPCLSRSPPRTVGALRVLPPSDDLARTMAPDAVEWPNQLMRGLMSRVRPLQEEVSDQPRPGE
jgi:hypothetical protein